MGLLYFQIGFFYDIIITLCNYYMFSYTVYRLALLQSLIIALSNVLVQYPFTLFGFKTTYGAITYPIIFVLTDITTRLYGKEKARQVILLALVPSFILSYIISNLYTQGSIFSLNILTFRIAIASITAYVCGQYLDIQLFQSFRNGQNWWIALAVSTIVSNVFDTYCFFFIAFYKSAHPFLNAHWIEIATVDLCFKLLLSVFAMVPLYGYILHKILGNVPFCSPKLLNGISINKEKHAEYF